jgi:hypothetical protein
MRILREVVSRPLRITLSLAILCGTAAWARSPDDAAPFSSAAECGQCHAEIHDAWQERRHARAATTPEFVASLQAAEATLQDRARPLCLACHAPTTTLTGDHAMERAITRESVTCDFCHSMVQSLPGRVVPFRLDVGDIKRGPYKDADPKGHAVAYSELHVKADLCAGCHEYESPQGVAVLSTYSEYLESPYAGRSLPCQRCHMPVVMAPIVGPGVQEGRPREFINLHRMPGGHTREQLERALSLEWGTVRRDAGGLEVGLLVANVGAGHRVPTGLPTRRITLEVEAEAAGGRVYHEQIRYQKVVTDTSGQEILTDGGMFLHAAQVRSDNRIAPGEQRLHLFTFAVQPGTVTLRARLVYETPPQPPSNHAARTAFGAIEKKVT